MVVQFMDRVAGTPVYVNPDFVVSARPDPAAPVDATVIKLSDGETVGVQGYHPDVASKLGLAA